MPELNEITITERERTYHVFFPYKHEIGWRGFKQVGMTWKSPNNAGGSTQGVYWMIPKDRLAEAVDVITYWYTERPLVGCKQYGVRVVEMADSCLEVAA